jgi:hypothetical protein
MPSYKLEYFDWRYEATEQQRLNARSAQGCKVMTASLAYPYMHILWEHPDTTFPGTGPDDTTAGQDVPQDTVTPTPHDPAARAREAERRRGEVLTEDVSQKGNLVRNDKGKDVAAGDA